MQLFRDQLLWVCKSTNSSNPVRNIWFKVKSSWWQYKNKIKIFEMREDSASPEWLRLHFHLCFHEQRDLFAICFPLHDQYLRSCFTCMTCLSLLRWRLKVCENCSHNFLHFLYMTSGISQQSQKGKKKRGATNNTMKQHLLIYGLRKRFLAACVGRILARSSGTSSPLQPQIHTHENANGSFCVIVVHPQQTSHVACLFIT